MRVKVGAVLVVGGGIAGIQASLDLADSGFKVYLLDTAPTIGGVMTQLDKTFPTNDCAMCILAPKLVAAGRHQNIELIMGAEIRHIEGEAGNFQVAVTRNPRYIDEEKCTGCGECARKCPIEAIDEYDERLSERTAIYVTYLQAVPLVYAIDRERCIGCGTCQEICKADAVQYDEEIKEIELCVGSIILSPGFEEFDPSLKSEYGYGQFPNVVSSIEFERILSASGPYGGVVLRPSDGKVPQKVAFIQCIGSRDAKIGNEYCSSACCMYSMKEAIIAKEHNPDLQCTIFFMDMRAYGKEFDAYYNRAEKEYGIRFIRCRVPSIQENIETQDLIIRYEDEEGKICSEEFNLAVLAVGMTPPKHVEGLAEALDIKLDKYGFCHTKPFTPLETSKPGIFVCGAFSSPKDIPESVAQASGAAVKASSLISSERGKLATIKTYPPERDVTGEDPRIGVFVCYCGINIGGVVDVPSVVEYAEKLPNVVYAEHNLYTCSQDTQDKIKETIHEYKLNRVIVASCTPRTHEPLFRETVREAGLNIYLFEMANIRDQCSWVHMHQHEEATEKSKDLVRSIIAKARLLKPLKKPLIDVTPVGLVVGGGLSGMTAALELAKQGFEVHLVEKTGSLGGHLQHIRYMLDSEDPQEQLTAIIRNIMEQPNIHVHLNSEVSTVEGYIGNFTSTLSSGETIEHGIVIVATGADEYVPTEYLYDVDEKVVTQRELEEKLADGTFNAKTVVMIQCVGSRTETREYCSRVCCRVAIKNALKIKQVNPEAEVYMLYRDIRTYGLTEEYTLKAREAGVIFIRFEEDKKPVVTQGGTVSIYDPIIDEHIILNADLIVLSVATVASPDNKNLAQMLKVPLSKDGFFLEAHMKLRPVDFATDGIFLCGLAHWPKSVDESIAQSCAAASRAITVLSNEVLEMEGAIASVNEDFCSGCGICESVCKYSAIEMREVKEMYRPLRSHILEALCKGCGVCGSSCPAGAISMLHFTDEQLLAQAKAVLREVD